MQVGSLGQEEPLEEGMATHSNILTWRTPWTEELDRLQFIGLQKVRHDWGDLAHAQCTTSRDAFYPFPSLSSYIHYAGYVLPSLSTASMLVFLACVSSLLWTLFHHVFKSCFPLCKKLFGQGQYQEWVSSAAEAPKYPGNERIKVREENWVSPKLSMRLKVSLR